MSNNASLKQYRIYNKYKINKLLINQIKYEKLFYARFYIFLYNHKSMIN